MQGAALIRMLRFVLGDKVFQSGLQSYMHKYHFNNTDHYDLFNEFTTAARAAGVVDWCDRPMNVTDFMNPWLMQRGFPVITIESQPAITILTQTPYNDISKLPANEYNYEWPVPVWILTAKGEEELTWVIPKRKCFSAGMRFAHRNGRPMRQAGVAAIARTNVETDRGAHVCRHRL